MQDRSMTTPAGVPGPVVPLPGRTTAIQIGDITGGPISVDDWRALSPGFQKLFIKAWIAKACQAEGVNLDVWGPRYETLIAREAGGYTGGIGDPNIVNLYDVNAQAGIPSMGLAQVIQPNAPGENLLDPVVNIRASIRHIKDAYGTQLGLDPNTAILRVQQADPTKSPLGYQRGGPVTRSGYGTRWHLEVRHPDGSTSQLPLRMVSNGGNQTHWEADGYVDEDDEVRVIEHRR